MEKIKKKTEEKATITTPVEQSKETSVDIYTKEGVKIDPRKISEAEKRMQKVLDTISKAGMTGKYMICITIHDPNNKLEIGGGDLHHYTFNQDFPNDDSLGCLDEYARLMNLGDK